MNMSSSPSSPQKRKPSQMEELQSMVKRKCKEHEEAYKKALAQFQDTKSLAHDFTHYELVKLNHQNASTEKHNVYTLTDKLETAYGIHTSYYLLTNYTKHQVQLSLQISVCKYEGADELDTFVGINTLPKHFFYMINPIDLKNEVHKVNIEKKLKRQGVDLDDIDEDGNLKTTLEVPLTVWKWVPKKV